MCLGVTELLSQAKVDDIDLIGPLAQSHQKVVWLDVAMDEALAVNILYPRDLQARSTSVQYAGDTAPRGQARESYQLVGQHEHCLQAELSVTEVEQILQTGA